MNSFSSGDIRSTTKRSLIKVMTLEVKTRSNPSLQCLPCRDRFMSTSAYETGILRGNTHCNHYKHEDRAERISYSMSGMPEMTTTATATVNMWKCCWGGGGVGRNVILTKHSSFLSPQIQQWRVRHDLSLVRKHLKYLVAKLVLT